MVSVVLKVVAHALLGACLLAGLALSVSAGEGINTNSDNVAIEGYDTVAYFTDGKPVKGTTEYELEWEDARWLFSSAEHRDMFTTDPINYAPQ